MKKTLLICTLCFLLLFVTACSNNDSTEVTFQDTIEFSSSEEMFNHMAGMWVVEDDAIEKSYYIFQNGQVYVMTDTMYAATVKELLDSAVQNGGLEALYKQDFASITSRMYLSDVAITPDPVKLFLQNGKFKLYDGKFNEQSIVITESSVFLVEKDAETPAVITKISDTADLSTVHFETLFTLSLDSYQLPTKYFLKDTAEYGEAIKSTISGFDWWTLTQTGDGIQVYTPNDALSPISGSKLLISKESVTYIYKTSVSTGFIGQNHEELLTVNYRPEDGEFEVIEVNASLTDMYSLMAYGLYAIQDIPGVYTDPETLYSDMLYNGEVTETTLTLKVNGIEYFIDESDTYVQFKIQVDDTISLAQAQHLDEANKNYAPLQSGTLEQLLDGSKSWVAKWKFAGWEYNVHFVFKEDGTCYFALSELELLSAGMGTYTVKNGNTLHLSLAVGVEDGTDIYTFDPDDFSLTVVSTENFAAKNGDVFYLQEAEYTDAEQIINWGNLYSGGAVDSEEWE